MELNYLQAYLINQMKITDAIVEKHGLKLEEYSCFCDTDYVDQQLVEEAYKSLRAYYQNRRYSKQQTKQSKLQTISDARLAILDYINQHGIRSDFLT